MLFVEYPKKYSQNNQTPYIYNLHAVDVRVGSADETVKRAFLLLFVCCTDCLHSTRKVNLNILEENL